MKKHNREHEEKALKEQAEEYKKHLQRLQAEFENFTKRTEKEKQEHTKFLNAGLLKDFLPLADTIAEARKQSEKNGSKEAIHALEEIGKQLSRTLERQGVKEIETTGKKFDYEMHECLMTGHEEGKEDDLVLEEFQKGYTLNNKVLRPAKVKVNKIQ